jgi:filamentous hemagglutinin family protein
MTMKFCPDFKSRFRILSKGRVVLALSIVTANLLVAAPASNALPTNPNVVSGGINIQTNNATMTVNQSTNKGIINWGSFNIGKDASVQFNQPNASASTLNRVVGGELSQIAGSLSANGNIILINPNGVIFQNGSRVDVGGIVASTMNLSNDNYLNNTYHFTRDGATGAVTNEGTINTADAGYVALLAPEVLNTGVITARKGTVAFAAGDAVTLDFQGNGLLHVEVEASMISTLIDNKHLVQADGGVVYMSSKAASDAISSTISNTGTIQANALEERDGKIILFAHDGTMNVDGTIEAKGGFVETSGKNVKISDTAKVTTLGTDPTKGEWLIDPTNFTISAGSAAQTTSGIGATTLEGLIAGNATTTIATSATANGSDLGDIIIDAPLSWSANALSLSAHHSVLVNNVVTVSGTGGLTVTTNTGNYTDTSTTSAGYLKMKQNRSGLSGTDTFDGKINWSSSASPTINSNVYTVLNTASTLRGDIAQTGTGYFALGSDITLTGSWSPINNFSGSVDGFGHTISGLSVSLAANSPGGMFATVTDGMTLSNMGLINSTITNSTHTAQKMGGFIGSISSATTAVKLSNIFTGADTSVAYSGTSGYFNYAGGLVGEVTGKIVIKDSYNAANINAGATGPQTIGYVGGIVGIQQGSTNAIYSNLYNVGTLIGGSIAEKDTPTNLNGTIGGIAGYFVAQLASAVVLTNLSNYGNIYGAGAVAGLLGYTYISGATSALNYTKLSNTGNISGTSSVGGLFGNYHQVDPQNTDTMEYLSNKGTITGTSSNVGGLAGILRVGGNTNNSAIGGVTIRYAYNEGAINDSAGNYVGGLFGVFSGQDSNSWRTHKLTLEYAYNSGNVTGNYYVGGIAGGLEYFETAGAVSEFHEIYSKGVVNALNTPNLAQNSMLGAIFGYRNGGSYALMDKVYVLSGTTQYRGVAYSDTDITNNVQNSMLPNGLSAASGANYGVKSVAQLQSISGLGYTASKWYESGSSAITLQGFSTPLTYTLSNITSGYTYDGNAVSLSSLWSASSIFGAGYSSWVAGTDYSFSYGGNTVTGFTNANTYSNIGINILNSGYSSAGGTAGSLTISPATLQIVASKTYDGSTNLGSGTVTFGGLVNGQTLNYSGVTISDKNVATANKYITAITLSDGTGLASNYAVPSLASKSVLNSATVTKADLQIIATKTYDGSTNLGSGTVAFGGLATGETLTYSGVTINDKDVATAQKYITAITLANGTGGGDTGNYQLPSLGAYSVMNRATVNKATLTVTGTKVYDGTTAMATYLTLGGFAGTETVGYSSATASNSHVATANKYITAITLTDGTNGGLAANYQISGSYGAGTNAITITAKTLTPTISNIGVTKVYDGDTNTAITPTYTITGFVTNDTAATLTNTSKLYDSKDAGVATKVTVSGLAISGITGTNASENSDYALASTSLDIAASITPKTLTVSGLTASHKNYDGTTDVTISNWGGVSTGVGTETLTLNHGTASFASADKANGITVTATGYALVNGSNGGLASNYALSSTTATTTANITARTVTLAGSSGVTKVYDGLTSMPIGLTGYGSLVNGISGDDLYVAGTPVFNSHTVSGADTILIGTVALAGTKASNYTLSWTNGTGSISKATLTVNANNDAKFVTQNDVTNFTSVSYSGFVNGETTAVLTTTGLVVNRAPSFTQQSAGIYSDVLVPSGLAADNYQFNYVNGDYTIVPADQLLVRVQNASTTYATNAQYTITSAEYLNGSNQIVALDLSGINSGTNFTLNDGVGGTATFTLNASDASLSSAGLLKAGSYQVGATNISETSNNFSNTLTVIGALNVNQKAVTVNAGGVSKVYDGTTRMDNLTLGLLGVETGDVVAISGNGSFVGKNVGTGKDYTLGSLTLSSTDASNYYLSSGNSMSGNDGEITKKTVTLSASKTYDGSTDLTGYVTINTGVTVDGVTETLTYSGATSNSSEVTTTNKYINAITLEDATDDSGGVVSNYQLSSLTGSNSNNIVDITARPITLTADAKSKTYGDANPALTYQIEAQNGSRGLVNSDTFSGSLATTATQYSNVGDYAIVSTLANGNYVISYVPANLSITKRDLTVIADSFEQFVGLQDPLFTYVASGFVGSDTVNVLSGSLTREQGSIPATYAILQGDLDAQNYEIVFTSGSFKIKPSSEPTPPPPPPPPPPTPTPTPVPPLITPTTIPTPPPPPPSGPSNPLGDRGETGGGTGTYTGTGGDGGGTGTDGSTTGGGTRTGTDTEGDGTFGGTGTGTGTEGGNTGGGTGTGTGTEGGGTTSGSNENGSGNAQSGSGQSGQGQQTSFEGLSIGSTQSGSEIKAIIIQGASTSPTPVTMLVSVKPNEGFSFSVPRSVVNQVAKTIGQNSGSKVEVLGASLLDGSTLPIWLSFNANTASFSANNVPVGALPLTVKVVVSNGESTKTIEVVIK